MTPEASPADLESCRRLAAEWGPVLHALGNPDRLLIVLWLAGIEASVRDLEQVTGLGQSLVSYHLRQLRDAGLVVSTAVGRSNRYRLATDELDELAAMIGRLEPSATPGESGTG